MEHFKIPLLPGAKRRRRSVSPEDRPSKRHFDPPKQPYHDVFPVLSEEPPPLPVPMVPELPTNLSKVLAFVIVMRMDRIKFQLIPSELGTANMKRVLKESQRYERLDLEWVDEDWPRIEHRLRSEVKDRWRNEDIRLGFRWNHTFLVKKYFTFGYRTPKAGTVHVYQTSAMPIVYYEVDERRRKDRRYHVRTKMARKYLEEYTFSTSDKRFSAYELHRFRRYVLQPNSIYRMRAGTTYLILTYDKTLFNCWIERESPTNLQFGRPTRNREVVSDASRGYHFNVPPATPVWTPPPPTPSAATEEPYAPFVSSMPVWDPPATTEVPQMYLEQPMFLEQQPQVYYVMPPKPEMVDAMTDTVDLLPQTQEMAINTEHRCDCYFPPIPLGGRGSAGKQLPKSSPEWEPFYSDYDSADYASDDERVPPHDPVPGSVETQPPSGQRMSPSELYSEISSDVPEETPARKLSIRMANEPPITISYQPFQVTSPYFTPSKETSMGEFYNDLDKILDNMTSDTLPVLSDLEDL